MIRQEKNALLLALAVAACRSTGPEALEVSADAAPAPEAMSGATAEVAKPADPAKA